MSFGEFKVALRSFEETEKLSSDSNKEDTVMKVIFCYGCGKPGHKQAECRKLKKPKKNWCDVCKSHTHQTEKCRKKNHQAKSVSDNKEENGHEDKHSFIFKVGISNLTSDCSVDGLLVDRGATTHIVHDITKFVRFDKQFNPNNHYIELADGSRSNNVALKRGDASVQLCDVDGNVHEAILTNTLYVPSYKQNIFSVQAATSKGASVCFSSNDARLVYPNGTEFKIEKCGNLYYLNKVVSSGMSKQNSKTKSLKEWHEIMGHCNLKDVVALEGVVDGMKLVNKDEFDCDVCVKGKMTQTRKREPDKRAGKILELVHCDLAGPIQPAAKEGFKYAVSFTDDYSGVIMIYFIRQKSDTFKATEQFLADSAPYSKVKRLRTDNGTEFTSESFRNILLQHSIKHEKSAPYSPHQNGTAERGWRSLFEMARCLLIQADLPKNLWSYAAMCAVYIRNRCYNHRLKKTPHEAFTGHKPNLQHMHIFGTVCFAYIQEKKKLDDRAEKGIFVGYDKGSPAYLIYYRNSGVIKKSRCVRFTDKFETDDINAECIPIVSHDVPCQTEPQTVQEERKGVISSPADEPRGNVQAPVSDSSPSVTSSQGKDVHPPTVRYPSRAREKPNYLGYADKNRALENDNVSFTIDYCYNLSDAPSTYEGAMALPDASKWQKAMEEEIQALRENDTFELTPLPEGRKAVGGRWVYALKQGPNGKEKYKARFVAKGYSQVAEIDYHETFSPTAQLTSIRILMQLAVQYNLTVHQMDVKSAYLNAP